jgi:putative phage-type endonuclease
MNEESKGAWLNRRCGRLTGSRMNDALDFLKNGKPGSARTKYMHEILAERLTGNSVPHYVNDFMRWGIEQEPHAKTAFEEASGAVLLPCSFFEHATIPDFGATPDGLLEADTVVEFKCPQTTTHIAWKLAGEVPEQHRLQILAQLACSRRTRAVFVSFDPRCPPRSQLFIREWTPATAEIEALEEGARTFLAEVEQLWEVLVS